jgi:hypothetical protein
VNTRADEMHPWLADNGLALYFSRKTREGWRVFRAGRAAATGPDGFGAPRRVELPPDFHHASIAGEVMYLQGPVGKGRWGLFRSRRTGTGWSRPESLVDLDCPDALTGDRSPCVSHDGGLLFFASDRPGGQGGLDIWAISTRALGEDAANAPGWRANEPPVDKLFRLVGESLAIKQLRGLAFLALVVAVSLPGVIGLVCRLCASGQPPSEVIARVRVQRPPGPGAARSATAKPTEERPPFWQRRGGLLAAFALVTCYVGYVYHEDWWFLGNAERAPAAVIKGNGDTLHYEFQDAAGRTHTGRQGMTRYLTAGEQVHVWYLAEDPDQNRLVAGWSQRDLLLELLLPLILCAWYGWTLLSWSLRGGAWRALAEQYPAGSGAGRHESETSGGPGRWFHAARIEYRGHRLTGEETVVCISAGPDGLRLAGPFLVGSLYMPWHPALEIPWSDLDAETAGVHGVRFTAARAPGVDILVAGEVGPAIAARIRGAASVAGRRAPAAEVLGIPLLDERWGTGPDDF